MSTEEDEAAGWVGVEAEKGLGVEAAGRLEVETAGHVWVKAKSVYWWVRKLQGFKVLICKPFS